MGISWLCIFILISLVVRLHAQSCESVVVQGINIDGEPLNFYWMDDSSQRGLLLTSSSKVYLTESYGKSWTPQTFSSEAKASNYITEISQSSDLTTVYAISEDYFWLTEDAGRTWVSEQLPDGEYVEFYPHPFKPHWILATSWNSKVPCQFSLSRSACYLELWVSYDSGKTWASVDRYVDRWQWASDDEILYTSWDTDSGNQLYKNSAELSFYASTYVNEGFQTRLIMDLGAVEFAYLYQTETLWVAKRVSQQSTLSLYSSTNVGVSLNVVYFGQQEIQQNRYTLYESPEGDSVFIILESPDSDEWGNLYRSDSTYQYFSLILPYVIKRSEHDPDLTEFAGLPGVYIANNYNLTKSGETVIESHISYTSGSTWEYLPAPAPYLVGPNKCIPPCGVHLDMDSDAHPLSISSAPGLMLAVGNIGNYFQSGVNTGLFFTREAGTEWERIRTDRWDLYEMGDYGNLLLAAQQGKTDVAFSWDQGLNWVECVVSTDLQISNLWAVPNKPFLFLMTLRSSSTWFPEYQLVWANFSELHERECEGFDSPDAPESDYETWVPPVNGNECVMGQKETFIRRKQQASCFVPEGDAIKSVQTCQCTFEDYECDYCYIRNPETQLCVYYCEDQVADLEAYCGDGQKSYNKSQGYRKISGNVCEGTTQYDPVESECPSVITTGTTGLPATTGTTGTTGTPAQTTGIDPNDQTSNDDDEDMLPVIILAIIVGVATLIGLALLVTWLIQAKNKPVPEELRDVGEANRLYDRT